MSPAQEALKALTGQPYQMAAFMKKYHVTSISGFLAAVLESAEVTTKAE